MGLPLASVLRARFGLTIRACLDDEEDEDEDEEAGADLTSPAAKFKAVSVITD